ncbi:tRNA(fMet)-specific endonuclease VapC [subsurface metagenome]
MAPDYILDSYALLAYLEAEPGGDRVAELLEAARERRCRLYLCVINLGEVMYIVERERGLTRAQETLARIDELPVEVVDADRTLTMAAAHLKAQWPLAYADCFAAALAQAKDAPLLTGDPEFHRVGPGSALKLEWLCGQG